MTPSSARELARTVLARLRAEDVLASEALHDAFLQAGTALSASDKGLATELVYGASRHRRFLLHVLAQYADLAPTKAAVLDILLLAAYQIVLLDRVPSFAAVDEATQMAGRRHGDEVAGFCNAVLRKVAAASAHWREAQSSLTPAVAYSLPDWMAAAMQSALGGDLAPGAAGFAVPARLGLRVHAQRESAAQVCGRLATDDPQAAPALVGEVPGALTVKSLGNLRQHPLFVSGQIAVQDVAAQLCGHMLGPKPGERILDMCAGVGGKATQLAELAPQAQIDASDMAEAKLTRLAESIARLGVTNIAATQRDWLTSSAEQLAAIAPYDAVLLDAPCSGLGIMRRHPEIKWRRKPEDLDRAAATSRALFDVAAQLVRPGGRLVFAVCTWTRREGPRQLSEFLARHPDFTLCSRDEVLAEAGAFLAPYLAADGTLVTWPHLHDCDGFFAARLRRAGGAPVVG
ncbi:MAG: methyltransferase domain-containing protein [Myxococcales bacterium]|nr:methyltransferase domain-containing protein [Myxococcales bacterium]